MLAGRLQKLGFLPRSTLLLFAAALAFDVPSAQAYNEYQPWTEILGFYLFHGLREWTGLPVPFTAFEVLSYSLLTILMILGVWQRARLTFCLGAIALLLPVIAAAATAWGMFQGNSLSLAMTQLHFLPMISVWLLIGSWIGQQAYLQARMIRVLYWVCVWRAGLAWYVYLQIYGGTLGSREFLIDHASSMFLALGMSYALFQAWNWRKHWRICLGYATGFAFILGPYVLNERRASFAGIIAAMMLIPWVLPPRLRSRIMPLYRNSIFLGLVGFVILSYQAQDANSFAGALRTETLRVEQLTYRHIENYNLMLGVIENPWLGLGFGTNFPQALELPDISFTFPLYQAIPHNNVYFLWAFAGPFGLAALTSLSSGLLLLIVRNGRLALRKSDILVSLLALVALTQWLLYVVFDMGLLESRSMMLVGIFVGSLFPSYASLLGEHSHEKLAMETRLAPMGRSPRRLSKLLGRTHRWARF